VEWVRGRRGEKLRRRKSKGCVFFAGNFRIEKFLPNAGRWRGEREKGISRSISRKIFHCLFTRYMYM
jgi:hypothetical protein